MKKIFHFQDSKAIFTSFSFFKSPKKWREQETEIQTSSLMKVGVYNPELEFMKTKK